MPSVSQSLFSLAVSFLSVFFVFLTHLFNGYLLGRCCIPKSMTKVGDTTTGQNFMHPRSCLLKDKDK